MYDHEWESIAGKLHELKTKGIPPNQIPLQLYGLLIAAEDHRFHRHNGVDLIALIRASWKTFFKGKREGGSTVPMQLVRVLSNNYELTLTRKTKEIFLALRLNNFVSRYEILTSYLSVAYFGWNMIGIEQACLKLKLDIKHLSPEQMASLIARLKYPEPKANSERKANLIKVRTRHILNRYSKLKIGDKYGRI